MSRRFKWTPEKEKVYEMIAGRAEEGIKASEIYAVFGEKIAHNCLRSLQTKKLISFHLNRHSLRNSEGYYKLSSSDRQSNNRITVSSIDQTVRLKLKKRTNMHQEKARQ